MIYSNTNITRTVYRCVAYGYSLDAMVDGGPLISESPIVEFITTKKNDTATANKALRDAGVEFIKGTLVVEVQDEFVMSMSLHDFYHLSEYADHAENGRISK